MPSEQIIDDVMALANIVGAKIPDDLNRAVDMFNYATNIDQPFSREKIVDRFAPMVDDPKVSALFGAIWILSSRGEL